jgi:hypothetical protein
LTIVLVRINITSYLCFIDEEKELNRDREVRQRYEHIGHKLPLDHLHVVWNQRMSKNAAVAFCRGLQDHRRARLHAVLGTCIIFKDRQMVPFLVVSHDVPGEKLSPYHCCCTLSQHHDQNGDHCNYIPPHRGHKRLLLISNRDCFSCK